MTLFVKYPEFIDTDPRVDASVVYNPNDIFCQHRYEANLPPELIQGKTILDVGCCVGTAGAWALHYGAKKYIGVEVNNELSNRAVSNLTKYFDESCWDVINANIDEVIQDFYTSNIDIVLLSSVVYLMDDLIANLKHFAKVANNSIIIETLHPNLYREIAQNNYGEVTRDIFNLDDRNALRGLFDTEVMRDIFEYKMPIMLNLTSPRVFTVSDGKYATTTYNGNSPSIGFLDIFFKNQGYTLDKAPNEMLKKTLPEYFTFPGRYSVRFVKQASKDQQ